VLLLAAASSMSACIIPVGPNCQDPPTQPSSVPELEPVSSTTPQFGAFYSLTLPMAQFEVGLSDPDPGAKLQYQWVFDYPVNSFGPPRLAGGETIIPPKQVSLPLSCQSVDTTQSTTHQLELYVTTGSFDMSKPSVFGVATDPNAKVVHNGWTIQFLVMCGS
jgi:hypothetical protein